MDEVHRPVLLNEAIGYLNVQPGGLYVDATFGLGGHAVAILKAGGKVLGLDADEESLRLGGERLSDELNDLKDNLILVRGNFREIGKIARENGFGSVNGVLFDLGFSSWQLEYSGRGFSFQRDEPLDMRLDNRLKVTAADLINGLGKQELYELFTRLGEETRARRLAELIVESRRIAPILKASDLAKRINQAVGGKFKYRHPATKIFQALRMAVNDELNCLRAALPQAFKLLQPKGRLVVISFHSLEDRLVKNYFRSVSAMSLILTKKPVTPSEPEIRENLRARSAKLRALELN